MRSAAWLRAVWVTVVVASTAAACLRELLPDRGPTRLGANLMSRVPREEVRRVLGARCSEWRIMEHTVRPLPPSKPEFDASVVSVGACDDLGMAGELRLLFFNGKLLTTWFYPRDLPTYIRRIEASTGTHLGGTLGATAYWGSTKIIVGRDVDGRDVVGWIDMPLERVRQNWLAGHA